MSDKTDWFPRSVKPVRVGVYEVRSPAGKFEWFSWWDGRRFNSCWATVEQADMNRYFCDAYPITSWRGVKEQK